MRLTIDAVLLTDLQTIIQSWQAIARRERLKVAMPERIDNLLEYRAGYAHGLENAANELTEALGQALAAPRRGSSIKDDEDGTRGSD